MILLNEQKKFIGDKYDYSKVEYTNSKTKVCIICPIHGEFWQIPSSHLSGKGCKKCGMINAHNKQKLTTTDFLNKLKEIHGDKYDYSKVEYVSYNTKVCIICPIHGEFWQTPDNLLHKHGCPSCGGSKKITTEEFIKRAKEVHRR